MLRSRFACRRVGILLALLIPGLILLHGLGSADAQFRPRPPIGPRPPFGPKGPTGPRRIVYDWRCRKCGALVATTTSPFSPGVANCPNCGVRFSNGGNNFTPPPNLPPANTPPGNMPPPNMPPNMPPGNIPPGNMPPPNMPPPNMPPANMPPANMPPANMPPANAPANPVVAPPADPAALAPPAAASCQWCSGEVSPGNRYCWRCKLVGGGLALGGTLVVVVVAAICAIVVFVFARSGR